MSSCEFAVWCLAQEELPVPYNEAQKLLKKYDPKGEHSASAHAHVCLCCCLYFAPACGRATARRAGGARRGT